MKILIAQSDQALAAFLRKNLAAEGYQMQIENERHLIIPKLRDGNFHLLILDTNISPPLELASIHCFIREIQVAASEIPLLILSAKAGVEDSVAALDAGADDFIAKPFSYFELAARVRARLRRRNPTDTATIQAGDLLLNRMERTVHRGGRLIELTSREFRLLEFLMRNYGRKVSRRSILEHVWEAGLAGKEQRQGPSDGSEASAQITFSSDVPAASMTNIVDVYVNYLRQKLGDSKDKRLIYTVRGVGYQLGPSTSIAQWQQELHSIPQQQTC